jgi:rod shape-determining protein MreC
VIKRELGRDQEIEAMPTVDFTRLDSALILITPPGDDQTAEAHPPTKGK